MKFLKSEGRVICLIEREDSLNVPPATLPHMDLVIIPDHLRNEILNSHCWTPLLKAIGNREDKIFYWR